MEELRQRLLSQIEVVISRRRVMNHNADDIPRSENDRRVATYHSFGQSNLDDEREGRYAAAGTRPAVTGSSPIAYPQQPSTSPWHSEPIGTEPPLAGC